MKKVLLEKEFDVSQTLEFCKTPLMWAMWVPKLAVYLIEKWGADVNIVPDLTEEEIQRRYNDDLEGYEAEDLPDFEEYKTLKNYSPLMYACDNLADKRIRYEEKYALCAYLVSHGADVNYTAFEIEDGETQMPTPLSCAISTSTFDIVFDENLSIVSLLLEHGAQVTDEARAKAENIIRIATGIIEEKHPESPQNACFTKASKKLRELLKM